MKRDYSEDSPSKHLVQRHEEKEKKHRIPLPYYTLKEEIFNAISHGVGVVFSVVALVMMLIIASRSNVYLAVTSAAIFGASMIILYGTSTLYHSLLGKAKRVFRVLDHCSIYVLIAGSYTPFILLVLSGASRLWMMTIIYGISILAIVLKAISFERFRVFSYISYVVLGWAIVFAGKQIFSALPMPAVVLLFLGGLCYTGGLVFFGLKKKYSHGIWHLFVLAGTIFHFFAVILFVF